LSLKTVGYLISSISVICLGAVSWTAAAEHPPMLAVLVVGMATSILGMLCRWISYRREKREEAALSPPQGEVARRAGGV
jgi:hypothetical protein